jgi:hypothetical protein
VAEVADVAQVACRAYILMAEGETCTICLSELGEEDRGALDGCNHQFCFDCIRKWLAETNSCPTCKTPAQSLVRRNANAAAILEVVQLDDVDNRQRGYLGTIAEMQEDADRREVCTVCGVVPLHSNAICFSALCQCFIFSHIVLSSPRTGVDDDDPLSLLCDSCDRTYHAACLPESDRDVGRRIARRTNAGEETPDWFCPVCATVHGEAVLSPSSASSVASSSSFYASSSHVWELESLNGSDVGQAPEHALIRVMAPQLADVTPRAQSGAVRFLIESTTRQQTASNDAVVIGTELSTILKTDLNPGELGSHRGSWSRQKHSAAIICSRASRYASALPPLFREAGVMI